MNTHEVIQGETSPIIYSRPSFLNPGDSIDTNWLCRQKLVTYDGVELIATESVTTKAIASIKYKDGSTQDEECFVVYFSPTQTVDLPVTIDGKEHVWEREITNDQTTPPFAIKTQVKLKVIEKII